MRTLTSQVSEQAQSVDAPTARLANGARVAALVAWPGALVAVIYSTVGRIGFVPSDQGFILAAAYRFLLGQVPHRDIISPRPLGTPLLHTLDFFLPGPLFETSTVVAIAEVIGYSIVFGALVYGIGPLRWRLVQIAGVVAAGLVNLHKFPLMVWPAIDGLLLVSSGFLLVHRGVEGRRWSLGAGFLLLGAACTVKQSFLIAPLLAMLYTGVRLRDHLGYGRWLRLAALVAALAAFGLFAVASLLLAVPAPFLAHHIGHPTRVAAGLLVAGLLLAVLLFFRARPLFAPMLVAAIAGALPAVVYVAAVAALGGLSEMRTQLADAAPAYGLDAFREVLTAQARVTTLVVVVVVAGVGTARRLVERWGGERAAAGSLVLRLALSGVIVYLVLFERLSTGGTWGTRTVLATAALTVVELVWSRDWAWAWPAVALLASAYMVMLSWGYYWPDLVAGSVALAAMAMVWRGGLAIDEPRRVTMALTALAVTAAVAVGGVFLYARWAQPGYLEPAAAQVNSPMGDVSSSFGQMRTDPITHDYLLQIKQCIAAHPAERVAVLPDNAAIYPALGLDDPFPIDWLFPPEYVGSETQLLSAAQRLDQSGHFLVLFQSVYAADLSVQAQLPAATPDRVNAILSQNPVLAEIHASLHGEQVTCGSFAGIYRP
jgi:hypothetical protein